MSRYIDANALYEKTAEWEAQALHMVELHINDEDKTEWKRWSVILTERSAFKFDIADSPTANVVEVVHGEWLEDSEGEIYCSKCGKYTYDRHDEIKQFNGTQVIALCYPRFCGNCGADMRGEEDVEIH